MFKPFIPCAIFRFVCVVVVIVLWNQGKVLIVYNLDCFEQHVEFKRVIDQYNMLLATILVVDYAVIHEEFGHQADVGYSPPGHTCRFVRANVLADI